MIFLYSLVLLYLKIYRFFHLIVVKYYENVLTKVLIRHFKRLGVLVVKAYDENGAKNENLNENFDGPIMIIKDPRFFVRFCQDRSIGLGESYTEGWWECEKLKEFSEKIFSGKLIKFKFHPLERFAHYLEYQLFNLQTVQKSLRVAQVHYDQGNEVFEKMLGPTMNYTCAYWRRAKTLDEAQTHKMDLIAQKLKLSPGMRVLDLGCGWGALARHLAQNYQVSVVAVNIGKEGCKYAEQICQGLPVEVRLCDYREINEKFDRVVSIGMTEHVGPKNYDTFFEVVDRCLVDNGLFLLHSIGNDDERTLREDPWNSNYVFINGALPRAWELAWVARNRFTLEDWHNFGPDYAKTLMCWWDNLTKNWDSVKHLYKNSTEYLRLWDYMMHMAAGAFECRSFQLWQIVYSKKGYPGGYESVRDVISSGSSELIEEVRAKTEPRG